MRYWRATWTEKKGERKSRSLVGRERKGRGGVSRRNGGGARQEGKEGGGDASSRQGVDVVFLSLKTRKEVVKK